MTNSETDADLKENRPSVKNLRTAERVSTWFIEYFYKYIFSKDVKVDPYDTLILKAHYNFTAHLLITIFVFVTSHWLAEEPIICIDRSDQSRAPEDYIDICLTYPFTEFFINNDKNRMVRRYALHYKWVHIACLIVSFIYKGVILAKKMLGFEKHRKMLQDVCEAPLLDRFWIAKRYFINHNGCHKNMYTRFLSLHVAALLINILSFAAFNITFQNHYYDLPKHLFTSRDSTSFQDQFSLIFPPFVKCEVNPVHHIIVGRSKWYGCHLPLMEIYEKIFMMIWFWQAFLAIWTIVFIFQNIPVPWCLRWRLCLLNSSNFNRFEPYRTCASDFSVDDILALKSVKSLLLGNDYVKLICALQTHKNVDDSLDPDDTVYYDQDLGSNRDEASSETANATSFQSCIQEENQKPLPNIGFESLLSPLPNEHTDFNPITESTMMTSLHGNETLMDAYEAWKRNVSHQFENSFKRKMSFNAKIDPLLQYLRRDEGWGRSASASQLNHYSPSAPRIEKSAKYFTGGEQDLQVDVDSNWEVEADYCSDGNGWPKSDTDANSDYNYCRNPTIIEWPHVGSKKQLDPPEENWD